MNLDFKGFPEKSFPLLLSAFVGIIDLSGLLSKVQKSGSIFESSSENMKLSTETLLVEMQPLVLEKKMNLTI